MTPEEKLAAIAALHYESDSLMDGPDTFCVTCTESWPCETRRILNASSVGAARAGGIDRGDVAQVLAEVKHEGLSIFDGMDRVLALVQPALDVAAPVWAFTPEGHDDEYEYVVTTDCYGQYPNTLRRTPKRVVPVGEWESIPNLPPKEQRRSIYEGEEVRP